MREGSQSDLFRTHILQPQLFLILQKIHKFSLLHIENKYPHFSQQIQIKIESIKSFRNNNRLNNMNKMNFILAHLWILIIVVSCSQNPTAKQGFSFKLSAFSASQTSSGGTFVRAISNGASSTVKLDDNNSADFPYGNWEFQVVQFSGPTPYAGVKSCGSFQNANISSTNQDITINLTVNNCINEPFISMIASLNIPPSISNIEFTTVPISAGTNSQLTVQPVVTVYDTNSNINTSDSSSVVTLTSYDNATCSGNSNESGLSGTTTATLVNGVASFSGIGLNDSNIHSIQATVGSLTTCSTSKAFIVSLNTINSLNASLSFGYSATEYDVIIDWGDENSPEHRKGTGVINSSHSYSNAGGYTVVLYGNLSSIFLGYAGDVYRDIIQWGNSHWQNLSYAFSNCSNLTMSATDVPDLSAVEDMSYMFEAASSFNGDISDWDVGHVTNMEGMFQNATRFNQDIGGWNTANVTNMSRMFEGAQALTELNFTNFNTSSVTDMSWMFSGTSALSTLDLSHFNTSSVTNMARMFNQASSLTSLDLRVFDTSNVTNMSYMFCDTYSLSRLEISKFETRKVTDMSGLFFDAHSLVNLNLNSFNTENVTDMSAMFYNDSALTSLNLSNFNTSSVTTMLGMFGYDSALINLSLANFNTRSVTNMTGMFSGNSSLLYLNTTGWNLTYSMDSQNVFSGTNSRLTVTCDQGGSSGSGSFFGKTCN